MSAQADPAAHRPDPRTAPRGKRVGVIGVGNMGLAMVERLCAGGAAVVVHDVLGERLALAANLGADVAPDSASVAGRSATVIVAVVDAAQTEAVLFGEHGVRRADPPPRTVLLCPTIAPGDVERLARGLEALGIEALDAPMSGGPARAREGRMSLMVAGDDAVFERAAPLLHWMADPVFRVGRSPGDGARTKLVNNLLAAANLAAAAEALSLAEAAGLDPQRTLEVIEHSSGQSWIGSERARRWLAARAAGLDARSMPPTAHAALLAKDSALALDLARALALVVPIGDAAAAAFATACREGDRQCDDAVLFERAREAALARLTARRSSPD